MIIILSPHSTLYRIRKGRVSFARKASVKEHLLTRQGRCTFCKEHTAFKKACDLTEQRSHQKERQLSYQKARDRFQNQDGIVITMRFTVELLADVKITTRNSTSFC